MRLSGSALCGSPVNCAGPEFNPQRSVSARERWYVVRNSCLLLGEMRDPDLIAHLAPALRHSDERVQRAALQSLQKAGWPAACALMRMRSSTWLRPYSNQHSTKS